MNTFISTAFFFAVVLLIIFPMDRIVSAETGTIPRPVVTVTSADDVTENITVTFTDEVPVGNLVDIELINSHNSKIWQQFPNNGGKIFKVTPTALPADTYTVSIGLFSSNWGNNYAWFSNLAQFTIPNPKLMVTPTATTSGTVTPMPTQTNTPTPTAISMISPAAIAHTAYLQWKAKYIEILDANTARVVRPENSNDTVSEGMGYGMLLSMYDGDHVLFSQLWNYVQKYMDSKGLMNWQINATGTIVGTGSATDADEDMAYALLIADNKWSKHGYADAAKKLIQSIKLNEVRKDNLISPGEGWVNSTTINPSYLSPSIYTKFAQATGDTEWDTIAAVTSNWLSQVADQHTGLVPDWLNADFSPATNISWDTYSNEFYYDAVRNPIRMLLDYKLTGNVQEQTILQKQAAFFTTVGTANLKSGYSLSGNPLTNYLDTAFMTSYTAAGQVNPTSTYAKAMNNNLINMKPDGYFGTTLRALTLFIIAQ